MLNWANRPTKLPGQLTAQRAFGNASVAVQEQAFMNALPRSASLAGRYDG
jgi:hypothetical protein